MKKQLLLLTYTLFLVFSLQAQIHFFIEASGNMSLIPKSEKIVGSQSIDPATTYTLYMKDTYNENYKGIAGGNIMVGLQAELKNDFSLESGLELTLIKFNRDIVLTHESMYLPVSNVTMPVPPDSYYRTGLKSDFGLTYLSIPVSVFYQPIKRKLYVGGGVLPGLLVHSSSITDDYMFSKLSIAAQLQTRYKMTEKISIVAAFQQYLSPIFKEGFSPNKTKNRLVKLGLRYDI